MDMKNLIENIETVITCAKAIEYELENNSGDDEEAKALYQTLEGNGVTTDADEITAAVELAAEISSEDAAEINSALELWENVESNGHDTDDIGDALDVYAAVSNSSTCPSDIESAMEIVGEWTEHCGDTWEDPESMAKGFSDQCDIIAVFVRLTGRNILSVEDAEIAVSHLGSLPAKEQALLDAIKAFCEPNHS
tara:strand:+ start:43 stop:624 length:582 start_codon:yes stop_codon:yes gene_type:complete